jgi:3-hydroxybutyryl-CoA dehydrogenase
MARMHEDKDGWLGRLVVIGAGTMGHGIAHVAAMSGVETLLVDVETAALERGLQAIRRTLEQGVEKGKIAASDRDGALTRLHGSIDLEASLEHAEIVIEAVPENLALKKVLFERLDRLAPERALLGTNTSSLPVSEIASVTKRPERVAGMHFFNPVHIMELLEIVQGERTSGATIERAKAVGARLGKTCIVVKDTPGFATSRLGLALGLEAMRMLEAGVASAEDIDTAMTLGYRHPIGPLKLTDLVGLDVRLAIAEHLSRTLGPDRFAPPQILRKLVSEGKLGRKAGHGFYEWPHS